MIRLGLYRHYKGGLYTVLGVVYHHSTGLAMVRYVSHDYNRETVRPLVGWQGDLDGFGDEIEVYGQSVPRFEFVRAVAL